VSRRCRASLVQNRTRSRDVGATQVRQPYAKGLTRHDRQNQVLMIDRRLATRPQWSEAGLRLLGGFELAVDGQPCDVPLSGQRLLVYLALHERAQHRIVVATALWPDLSERRASANLRASIWRLPEPAGLRLVRSEGPCLRLSDLLRIDCRVITELGWSIVEHPDAIVDGLSLDAFAHELLPGWYDDWVVFERERLAQLQVRFLEALTLALIEHRRFARALDMALHLVRLDPLRESSQFALLRVYLAEGDIQQAQVQVERYRELVQQTFGSEPSSAFWSAIDLWRDEHRALALANPELNKR
jgi:DNA-binding SARP family transcriptional activator